MVEAWYMDDDTAADCREEHRRSPNEAVSLDDLKKLGISYWFIDPEGWEQRINDLCTERSYKNRDEVIVHPERMPNYEAKIKMFFEEHLHEDEEIRYVRDGSGYFDVRDANDRWIRIKVAANDLIIVPAGIYHRFTTDTSNYIHAMRLFQDVPKWTPINRPAEDNAFRIQYLKSLVNA